MEALGGDLRWGDRFLAEHAALAYYWVLVLVYLASPAASYQFMEMIEVGVWGCGCGCARGGARRDGETEGGVERLQECRAGLWSALRGLGLFGLRAARPRLPSQRVLLSGQACRPTQLDTFRMPPSLPVPRCRATPWTRTRSLRRRTASC
jgi:hypothetical protein